MQKNNIVNSILKIIFKILSAILVFIILLLILAIITVFVLSSKYPNTSDYCIEDGDCQPGRAIIVNNKEIIINKDSCLEHGWDWYEKNQICKLDTSKVRFKVKEIIYE